MIDQGPGRALSEIEMLAIVARRDFQQPGLAQDAIRITHMIDRHDRVFAGDQP